jgi:hypothetical protein
MSTPSKVHRSPPLLHIPKPEVLGEFQLKTRLLPHQPPQICHLTVRVLLPSDVNDIAHNAQFLVNVSVNLLR